MKKTNLSIGRRIIPLGILILLGVALQAESQTEEQKRTAQLCDPNTGGGLIHNPAPKTPSKQQKMLSVFDKLDQLDQLDLLDAIDQATQYIENRDFRNAEATLNTANIYAHTDRDKGFIIQARARMNQEKEQQRREQRIAAQKREALRLEQERAEQALADARRRRRLQEMENNRNNSSDGWATAFKVLDEFGKNMNDVYEQQRIDQQNQIEYDREYKKLQQQVTENARRQQERVAEQRRQDQRAADARRREMLAENQRQVDEYERQKRQDQVGEPISINPWNEGFATLNGSEAAKPRYTDDGLNNATPAAPEIPIANTRLPDEYIGKYEYTTGAWQTRVSLNTDGTGVYWVQTLKNWNDPHSGYVFHTIDRQRITWEVDTSNRGGDGSMWILFHKEDGDEHPEAQGYFGSKTYVEGGHGSALLSKKNGTPYFGSDAEWVGSGQW